MLSAALMFFLVMDPLGNVPLFLTALRNTQEERRQWVILRELLIALALMVAFLFAGQGLMQILSINNAALEAAGGVILMLIAIRMVFPTPEKNLREPHTDDEPFIVPLAVPYVAGPSLLAIEVVLISQNPDKWLTYLGAIALAWAVTAVILYLSGFLRRVVGDKTLIAMERLMGMLLVILAVQMMFEGTRAFFQG